MKKLTAVLLCVLMSLTLALTVFAGEAKIKDMTSDSFQDGYPLELGYDGDINTRLSITLPDEDGDELVIELEEVSYVDGLSISWNNGHTRFYDVEVSVSTDNKNWTVAFQRGDTEVAEAEKGFSDLAFDKAYDCKYIKIHNWGKTDMADLIYDAAPNAWLTFWEIKVLTAEKPVTTAAPTTTAAPAPAAPAPAAPQTADAAVVIALVIAAAGAGIIVSKRK